MQSNVDLLKPSTTIKIEDFDSKNDQKLINGVLIPYLKDVYRDLLLRNVGKDLDLKNRTTLDKATFLEYC